MVRVHSADDGTDAAEELLAEDATDDTSSDPNDDA
jgi:hypothetical protein